MKSQMPDVPKSDARGHTVLDVIHAGFTLEPMVCLNPQCQEPAGGYVLFSQAAGDACCEYCGEWQLQFTENNVEEAAQPL